MWGAVPHCASCPVLVEIGACAARHAAGLGAERRSARGHTAQEWVWGGRAAGLRLSQARGQLGGAHSARLLELKIINGSDI